MAGGELTAWRCKTRTVTVDGKAWAGKHANGEATMTSEAIIILPLPKPASAKQLRKWRARAAAKARQAASVVMVAVQAVDAAATSGAAVPIPAVRQAAALPAWQFDAAVAQLVLERRVYVHRHDFPSSLPDGVRAELVVIDGVHYCGISLAIR